MHHNKSFILALFLLSSGCNDSPSSSENNLTKDNSSTSYHFMVLESDEEAPSDEPNVMQVRYEGIYLYNEIENTKIRISELGYKASPVISPDGEKIAYLHGLPTSKPTEIRVYDIHSKETTKIPVEWAKRNKLQYTPDGNSILYTTKNSITLLNLTTLSSQEFEISDPEYISVSPDGKQVVFMTRTSEDLNDSDGWILNTLNLISSEVRSFGSIDDNLTAIGEYHWHPDGDKFLIQLFDIDDSNKRSNYRYMWLSSDLEDLTEVENEPNLVIQWRYPWVGKSPWHTSN